MGQETIVGQLRPDFTDEELTNKMKLEKMSFADAWLGKFGTNEYEMVKIEEWIYNYCTGRYCIVDDIYFTKDRTSQVKVIGFENAGDLTLFGLSGLAQSR